MQAQIEFRMMIAGDYEEVVALWHSAEGVEVAEGDDAASIRSYLQRNPGQSQVALEGKTIVGAVLCGHDGRRGLIYHLAVAPAYRGQGVGRKLIELCLAKLKALGIRRTLVLVGRDNAAGQDFWLSTGFAAIEGALPFGIDL